MSVQFHDNSIRVKEALEDAVYDFLERASAELETQTARNSSPEKYRGKQAQQLWDRVVDESAKEAKVGSPDEAAYWEELGTGEYALEGNGRQGAWFVPVERVTSRSKPTFQGKVVVVYGDDGQAFYKTDGKRPKRMLHNAFTENKAKIIKRAEQIFKGLN